MLHRHWNYHGKAIRLGSQWFHDQNSSSSQAKNSHKFLLFKKKCWNWYQNILCDNWGQQPHLRVLLLKESERTTLIHIWCWKEEKKKEEQETWVGNELSWASQHTLTFSLESSVSPVAQPTEAFRRKVPWRLVQS